MRVAAIGIVVWMLAGCTTPSASWVRADRASFTAEQLRSDQVACFPDLPQSGPGSMGLEGAKACMRMKGWRKPLAGDERDGLSVPPNHREDSNSSSPNSGMLSASNPSHAEQE